ncbi:hypothetical protein B9Z19DRAFT_1065667 [Tuber borchii]|uniref:Uncharacterized protein n=1 Tax=Tuber borchii TaxID=42251 RepID=A0A2T6ZQC9_TUBBO|nr:hypothetical protein B9Z19DRAFT_1065667 [Tuber borchii]
MTPAELSQMLLCDEYLIIDISPPGFTKLEPFIGGRSYTYRPKISQLRVKMNTQIHGTVSSWAAELVAEGEKAGAWERKDLSIISEGRLIGFAAQYSGITKVLDCAIFPRGRYWPTVVFEFGYCEPYEDLKEDVKLLLEGSAGKISKVVIIKIMPLTTGQKELQTGFVEIWHLIKGKATKDGDRKNLFPIPKSHKTQKLMMTLYDILRNQYNNRSNKSWKKDRVVALPFDPLRGYLKEATWRYLIQKNVIENDGDESPSSSEDENKETTSEDENEESTSEDSGGSG